MQFKTPTSADAWQEKVVQSAEKIQVRRPWAVMVSTPGVVDERAGRVLLSPNLHWSEHADLPWMLRQIWSAPVGLVQEVRALALGELGARPDGDDFMHGRHLRRCRRRADAGRPHLPGRAADERRDRAHADPGQQPGCAVAAGAAAWRRSASQRGLIQSLREAKGHAPTHNLTFADVVKRGGARAAPVDARDVRRHRDLCQRGAEPVRRPTRRVWSGASRSCPRPRRNT